MRVLLAVASRHGSTRSIAVRIGSQLSAAGHQVEIIDITHDRQVHERRRHDHEVSNHDAFVIGSAVYEGDWMRPARQFLARNAIELQHAPVWLFSSGPLGDDQVGIDDDHIATLEHTVDAVDHHVFGGRLERDELGRIERWIVDKVRAPEGDFRDWDDIDAWAASIAARLDAGPTDPGTPARADTPSEQQ
jgi:menaquinone-dependent protoporphyrinogen oxidase